MSYTVSDYEGIIATVSSATKAVRAAEQYFQCGIESRDEILKQLRKGYSVVALHCVEPSNKVFIDCVVKVAA